MTLRPARRRRYALSQYATVRGFSLWQQEWFGFFFLGAVGVRLTLELSRAAKRRRLERIVRHYLPTTLVISPFT